MENNREWIEFLIKKGQIKLTEKEKARFEKDLEIFATQLKELDEFDLEGAEAIVAPFEEITSVLRDDSNVINNADGLVEGASNSKDGYILLKKEAN